MISSSVLYSDGVPVVATMFDMVSGEMHTALPGQHPNFNRIVQVIGQNPHDPALVDLFSVESMVRRAFQRLGTGRVTVDNGNVFYDGDPVHGSITDHILRALDEEGPESDAVQSLAMFIERAVANPQVESRQQLYGWLSTRKFTITRDGKIVGYKGCVNQGGVAVSSRPAPEADGVRVNDELVSGRRVENRPGDVITMPRSRVEFDPDSACAQGLHVGTYNYADSFRGYGGILLEVHVDPKDVVSVPHDSNSEKIRTCRYEVIGPIEVEYQSAILPWREDDWDQDDDWDDEDY